MSQPPRRLRLDSSTAAAVGDGITKRRLLGSSERGQPSLFSAAQSVNLLYRRLPIGSALVEDRRSGQAAVLQDGIRRYSRLAVCATNPAEVLNTYGQPCPRVPGFRSGSRGQGCPRSWTHR